MLKRSRREIILWMLGRRKRYKICGRSMFPTLKDGDVVLINTHEYQKREPAASDIVLLESPVKKDLLIVKRIAHIDEDGLLFLIGDNPEESTDSRSFGLVALEKIKGKVRSKMF